MPYLQFPDSLIHRAASVERPRLVGSARSAGRSASGVMLTGRVDGGGLWALGFNNLALRTPDHVRAWEAIGSYLAEGATPIVVPFCDRRSFPGLTVDGEKIYSYDEVPHSDESFFSDGSGYYQDVVEAYGDAVALRATTMTVDMVAGDDLRGGEHFAIEHDELSWRLYRVVTADEDGVITFEPPLREAIDAGTYLDFDRPRCVMQLNGAMPLTLDLGRFANPSVSFLESFLPEPS